jgi:probable H4MPT-linked C1 transfer pathway protein
MSRNWSERYIHAALIPNRIATCMITLGLDIGGANLKAAHMDGRVRSEPFEVWRRPKELAQALIELISKMPAFDALAVTMTAELCDCFETKSEGVHAVLAAVDKALGRRKRSMLIRVWSTEGKFVTPSAARAAPLKAAASNWLALATWVGRFCKDGPAIVADIGSTTSDIVPLRDGVPVPRGRTDLDRLACGELVYAGVRRTPAFAFVRTVDLDGRTFRVATESFATAQDVYVWLGDIPESPKSRDTSDNRPATRANAAARLARVLCADRSMLSDEHISQIAWQIADAQRHDLLRALSQVESNLGERARTVIVAGGGEFVVRHTIRRLHNPPNIDSIAARFGEDVSLCACAYAAAILAAEHLAQHT